MKTLLKLIVLGIVLHAAVRAGGVAWNYYKLRDTAQQLITFGSQVPTSRLRNQLLEMGWELGLPLVADDVRIQREGVRTTASARYTLPFEYFPNQFYPVELDFAIDAYSITPGVQDD